MLNNESESFIDDLTIKGLLKEYKVSREIRVYEKIVNRLSSLILNYPGRIHDRSEDECSDFYEYMLERLPEILKAYAPGLAKFTTWFFVVLRSRFLNWIRDNKPDILRVKKDIPAVARFEGDEKETDLTDRVQYKKWRNGDIGMENPLSALLEHSVRTLSNDQRLLLGLLYNKVDLKILSSLNWKPRQCQAFLRKTAKAEEGIRLKKLEHDNTLIRLNERLMELKNKKTRISRDLSVDKVKKNPLLDEIEARIMRCKREIGRSGESAGSLKLNLPYELAAEILGWSLSRVKRESGNIKAALLKKMTGRKSADGTS